MKTVNIYALCTKMYRRRCINVARSLEELKKRSETIGSSGKYTGQHKVDTGITRNMMLLAILANKFGINVNETTGINANETT
jgi:hypothetical protein